MGKWIMVVTCSNCQKEHNYDYEEIAKEDLNESFKEKCIVYFDCKSCDNQMSFQYEVNLEFCCTRDA